MENITTVDGEKVRQWLSPSEQQWTTIYILCGYVGGILLFWNLPYLKKLLYPFKLLTVALHEFGHAAAGKLTGAKIEAIKVNPDEGGVTLMRGGNPYVTLPAGYIGSALWGSIMVFAGFHVLASKIVALAMGVAMLLTLWWARNALTRIMVLLVLAILGLLWWAEKGLYLRYFILFLGTMSALYALWDIVEDLVVRKVNKSDAAQYAKICCRGCLPAQFWGFIWFLFSLACAIAAVLAALVVFKDDGAAKNGPFF